MAKKTTKNKSGKTGNRPNDVPPSRDIPEPLPSDISGDERGLDQLAPPSPTSTDVGGYTVPMAISIFPKAFEEVFGIPRNVLTTQFKEAAYHVIKSGRVPSSSIRSAFAGELPGGIPAAGGRPPLEITLRLQRAMLVFDVLEGLKRGIS